MKPWIKKYQPQHSSGILGQENAMSQLRSFVCGYPTQKKKAMILYGPPGCGKTSAVHAIGEEEGLEVVEVNASDVRNKESLLATVGQSMGQMSLFGKGKLILFDEIDGVSGTKDRGGIPTLATLIGSSAFPVIMTSNDPYDKKFSSLRAKSVLVEFRALDQGAVVSVLSTIADREALALDKAKVAMIARRTGGDLRAAINDLQSISLLGDLAEIDEMSERNKRDSIVTALMKIFKTTDPDIARGAFDSVDMDLDQIFLWVDENLPKEYRKPRDLARAYEQISKADVFRGRIRRWQHWRFMVYIYDLLSVGVALSKEERYAGSQEFKQTTRLLKIWQANLKYQRRKAIAGKIAQATHTSAKRALHDTLPYLQQVIRNSPKDAEGLIDELDLDKDDVAWLRK